jgi:hypothetical protein
MIGTVSRFIGVGVGWALEVDVSSVKVVDMVPAWQLLFSWDAQLWQPMTHGKSGFQLA